MITKWEGSIQRDAEGKPEALAFGPVTYVVRWQRGDRVIAFDSREWEQAGGDIGDNSCFYHPATVLRDYERDGENLTDIVFDHGRVSRGHFADRLNPLEVEKNGGDLLQPPHF